MPHKINLLTWKYWKCPKKSVEYISISLRMNNAIQNQEENEQHIILVLGSEENIKTLQTVKQGLCRFYVKILNHAYKKNGKWLKSPMNIISNGWKMRKDQCDMFSHEQDNKP